MAALALPWPSKVLYIAFNVLASVGIVLANKLVLSVYGFHFVITLTLIHTIFTWAGTSLIERLGFFERKQLPLLEVSPIAFGYVGYVACMVFGNFSLQLNPVGFYQLLKIMVTPTVMLLEFCMHGRVQAPAAIAAVMVVCLGVAAAVMTDSMALNNLAGVAVGFGSVVVCALYQMWAGLKQEELQATSSQLLIVFTPQACALLALMAPILDDTGLDRVGSGDPDPQTLLGYNYTPASAAAILVSALLGVVVSFSTFLVVGATSAVTFNVVDHSKTVLVMAGGCLFFGDSMPWKRLVGLVVAMAGIAWYIYLTSQAPPQSKAPTDSAGPGYASGKLDGQYPSEQQPLLDSVSMSPREAGKGASTC